VEFIYETGRIYANDEAGKVIAEVTFPQTADGEVTLDHTFVDGSLRGQGVAAQLCEAAYAQIKERGVKCVPTCPYAVKWFSEHPEKRDVLA
jgi:predicted GNAT family acetyltransferase